MVTQCLTASQFWYNEKKNNTVWAPTAPVFLLMSYFILQPGGKLLKK